MDLVGQILDFWFGPSPGAYRKQWFRKDTEFDNQIESRFTDSYWAMLASPLEPWLKTPKASLVRILILDQFARNIFRGTPQSFAADPLALTTADAAIDQGYDTQLLPVERLFLYMPFEHSEHLSHQERSVRYFEALILDAPELAHCLDYARRHRDIIAQFGRFPHRNEILGRQSNEAEQAFLQQPGSRF
ncbi:MAG: DUF924 family protein [Leptolyngbyaceae cyanobacterium]